MQNLLGKFNPASAAKGLGAAVAATINAAKFAGQIQAKAQRAMDDTDNDKIPQYQNAYDILLKMVHRLGSDTKKLAAESFADLQKLGGKWKTEYGFYFEHGKEVFVILRDLFVHVMENEKREQVALLENKGGADVA